MPININEFFTTNNIGYTRDDSGRIYVRINGKSYGYMTIRNDGGVSWRCVFPPSHERVTRRFNNVEELLTTVEAIRNRTEIPSPTQTVTIYTDDGETTTEPVHSPRKLPQTDGMKHKTQLQIIIDRNKDVSITCKMSKALCEFIQHNGRSQNVSTSLGSSVARNWDCRNDTNYIAINLRELERNFQGATNIITDFGINPLIIKIASANNGSWKVAYKGLVSKEQLTTYGHALEDSCKKFYFDYVKRIKIEVNLSTWEYVGE